ncbi:DUF742 domain-containing protein [Actinokineospora auranticolor]|nr:DUF742 domain-containing protein [Actinokineospora auranticolor]
MSAAGGRRGRAAEAGTRFDIPFDEDDVLFPADTPTDVGLVGVRPPRPYPFDDPLPHAEASGYFRSAVDLFGPAEAHSATVEVEPVPEPSPPVERLTDEQWLNRPESHALVRPYALTRGRTHVRGDLAVETLVSTVDATAARSWEHRVVTDLCARPRSVAEVAALIPVPLGVARVLISDLADAGALLVHAVVEGAPDVAFMSRVLTGLRNL